MRCLITGATGFVGRHLAAALLADGHEVVGLARRAVPMPFPLHAVELLDRDSTAEVIGVVRPNWLFHLAGYANAGRSFQEPDATWTGNLDATRSLYNAVRRAGCKAPRILYVSSGLVYGDAGTGEHVCGEDDLLRPTSPYAASKAAGDLLSFQEARGGLDIVRVRPFNQIGPGQPADYAVANFARQIAAIERGELASLEVKGDLNAQRDLTDVRDMARAYIRLLEVGVKGEVYNAGSGRTYVIHEVLDRLLAKARVPITVEEQMDASRSGETAISRADTKKIREATGWTPIYSLNQSLSDVLEDWRTRITHPI